MSRYDEYLEEFLEEGMDEELAEQMASYEAFIDYENSDEKDSDQDWEFLDELDALEALDLDIPQDRIDAMWDRM